MTTKRPNLHPNRPIEAPGGPIRVHLGKIWGNRGPELDKMSQDLENSRFMNRPISEILREIMTPKMIKRFRPISICKIGTVGAEFGTGPPWMAIWRDLGRISIEKPAVFRRFRQIRVIFLTLGCQKRTQSNFRQMTSLQKPILGLRIFIDLLAGTPGYPKNFQMTTA